MSFGGGGGSSDDAIRNAQNQAMLMAMIDWVNTENAKKAEAEREAQLQAEADRQKTAQSDVQALISQMNERENQWRAQQQSMMSEMSSMRQSFTDSLQQFQAQEAARLAAEQAERQRLADEATKQAILEDEQKQESLRQMRGALYAGGWEGTNLTQNAVETALTLRKKLLGYTNLDKLSGQTWVDEDVTGELKRAKKTASGVVVPTAATGTSYSWLGV